MINAYKCHQVRCFKRILNLRVALHIIEKREVTLNPLLYTLNLNLSFQIKAIGRFIKKGTLILFCFGGVCSLSCSSPDLSSFSSSRSAPSLPPLQSQEFKIFTAWLNKRVDLIIEHKANCYNLAQALVNHEIRSQTQVKSWKEAHFDQRLIQHISTHPNDEKTLKQLLQKGGMVYSFCAFFPSFHEQLKRGIEIGL